MSVSRHRCHHLNPNQLIPQIQNFNCSVNTGEFWNWKAQNNFLFTHTQEPLVIIPQRYTCHLRSDESVDECDQGCSDRHFSSLWVWLFWHWRTTADLLTSKESTINLTPEELRNMMGIVNGAKGSLFYFSALMFLLVNTALTAAMTQGEHCTTWFVGQWHEVPLSSILRP